MTSCPAVRVLIPPGTGREDAIKILHKIAGWIRRDERALEPLRYEKEEDRERADVAFREVAARAQGVLEMMPDVTELTVGNVRMGVVRGRLVDWRDHEVAPPESDIAF